MGVFKPSISIDELRQRNEQSQAAAVQQQTPQAPPQPAPKKG